MPEGLYCFTKSYYIISQNFSNINIYTDVIQINL